jgi:hypothetical protein
MTEAEMRERAIFTGTIDGQPFIPPGASWRIEVPNFGYAIDLVYVDQGTVVAVEFKLADWRRALEQAWVGMLAADKAWIAIKAMPRARGKILEGARRRRIGVLATVDGHRWDIWHPCPGSHLVFDAHRERIMEEIVNPVFWPPRGTASLDLRLRSTFGIASGQVSNSGPAIGAMRASRGCRA